MNKIGRAALLGAISLSLVNPVIGQDPVEDSEESASEPTVDEDAARRARELAEAQHEQALAEARKATAVARKEAQEAENPSPAGVTPPSGTFTLDDDSAKSARWLVVDALHGAARLLAERLPEFAGTEKVYIITDMTELPSKSDQLQVSAQAELFAASLSAIKTTWEAKLYPTAPLPVASFTPAAGLSTIGATVAQLASLASYFKADFATKYDEGLLTDADAVWMAVAGAVQAKHRRLNAEKPPLHIVRSGLDTLRTTSLFTTIASGLTALNELDRLVQKATAELNSIPDDTEDEAEQDRRALLTQAIEELGLERDRYRTWYDAVTASGSEGAPSKLAAALLVERIIDEGVAGAAVRILLVKKLDDSASVTTKQWLWTNPRLYYTGSASIAYSLSDINGVVLAAGSARGRCSVQGKMQAALKDLGVPDCAQN